MSQSPVIFRQLFEKETSTFTYILADPETRDAIIIDPVDVCVERDLDLVHELGLQLQYAINTHMHADHITGTGLIKKRLSQVKSVISAASTARADRLLSHQDVVKFGKFSLECLETPGHTNGCMCFVLRGPDLSTPKMVFTGDTLLIRGCGRTDFQEGDSAMLYKNVHEKLFTLPEETLVYPAHDYKGLIVSTISEEKKYNRRLTKTLPEFIQIMAELKLPKPSKIDTAVPANRRCGIQD